MRLSLACTARAAAMLAALPLALAACGGDDSVAPGDLPESAPLTTDAAPDESPTASTGVSAAQSPTASAAPAEDHAGHAGPLPVTELEPGMCFDDVATGLNEVAEVPVVPCDSPHANEVFALLEQPGEEFPGPEEIRGLADEGCSASFEPYVGTPLETSTLTPFPITPTAESWAQGDRQVVCVLTSPEPRTSSARGSGA